MKLKLPKIQLARKSLLIVAGVVALAIIGAGVAAAHFNSPGWLAKASILNSWHQPSAPTSQVGSQTITPSPAVSPTAKPSATPITTPSAFTKPTATPRYLDAATGPCQGIHAADDACVTKNTSNFQIASLVMWPQQVTCTNSSATVVFNPMTVTRHYLSGAGGTAQVQVQYSDGTTSPLLSATFSAATDVQNISGVSHTFATTDLSSAKFQVHLVSPIQNSSTPIDQTWEPINTMGTSVAGCPTPGPSPMY